MISFFSSLINLITDEPPIEVEVYYVRVWINGGYGNGDGTSIENAFNGEINIDWSVLINKDLKAIGFADGSINKLEPTTNIIYINDGIGVMIIESTFQIT